MQFTVKKEGKKSHERKLKMGREGMLVYHNLMCSIVNGKWRMKIWKGNYNFYEM